MGNGLIDLGMDWVLNGKRESVDNNNRNSIMTVSYTHLTLPTKRIV